MRLTTFVGRSQEMRDLRRLLSSTRLLTLTGAGGCGKTRLALEAAAQVLSEYRDGVWLVNLAALSDEKLVTQTAASVLKLQEAPNRRLEEVFRDFVGHRQLLLILDNCEHLITSCAQLAEALLQAGAGVRILTTSREALGVPGEMIWRVPSLSLPAPGQLLPVEDLLGFEAIRLFSDRARGVVPGFHVTDANCAAVVEICHRLDGIPLAIELAAARLKVLSLDQINARLKDRFRLLTGGSRTALARQRTLEATVDWSYELLTEAERQLMCRLSVFAGGWTLEAAEEVCSGNGIEEEETLDLLSHLVDKSLVNIDEWSECKRDRAQPSIEADVVGNRRYRFLETVRQYARERLLRSGDSERLRDLHFAFFLDLARRAEPELQKADQVLWLNRLQLEHDNLRSALDWALSGSRQDDHAQELAAALWWFWTKRGYFTEGRDWLQRALALDRRQSPRLRIKILVGLVLMMSFAGNFADRGAVDGELAALARDSEDLWAVALARFARTGMAIQSEELPTDSTPAGQLAVESHAAAVAAGDLWLESVGLMFLGLCAMFGGDYDRASLLYDQCVERCRPTGDKWLLSIGLHNAAVVRVRQGQCAQADVLAAEAILLNRELSEHRGTAWCLEALQTRRRLKASTSVRPVCGALRTRSWRVSTHDCRQPNDRLGIPIFRAL